MIFLLNVFAKVSVILVATLMAARLLRNQSAALRHCVLATGILCAAAMPALTALLPAWTFNVLVESSPAPFQAVESPGHAQGSGAFVPVAIPANVPATAATKAPSSARVANDADAQAAWLSLMNRSDWLLLVWASGSLLSLGILLASVAHLSWMRWRSGPMQVESWTVTAAEIASRYGLQHGVQLRQSDDSSALFTWGWRTPKILVPPGSETWPVERIRAVLCHELAHARRGDWILQITAEIVRAAYWFNPLVWLACRGLRRESEQACDDTALAFGISGSDYASHLLDVVRSLRPSRTWSYALSMASPSTLEQRFAAMLNPSLNRRDVTRRSIGLTLFAFAAVALPVAMLRAATQPPERAPAVLTTASRSAQPTPISPAVPQDLTAADVRGGVQGVVRRTGTGEPIAGVEIALEGGPADPKAVEDLIVGVANRGIIFKPKRVEGKLLGLGTVDDVLQDARDAASAIGVGPGFPLFQEAVNNFIIANAARYTATTDNNGRFVIQNVPPGEYTIHPEREGFFDPSTSPLKVVVESNRSAEVSVSLLAGGVMTGRVVDAEGRPVQDAAVDALMLSYENGFPVLRTAVSKTTDDQGEYRLFWLSPGDYYVMANVPAKPGAPAPYLRTFYPGSPDTPGAVALTIHSSDVLSGLDIQLRNDRLPKLSGRVTTTIPAEETAQQASVLNAALGRPTIMLVSRDSNKADVTGGGARVAGTVVLNGGVGDFTTTGVLPGPYDLYARIPESNAGGGAGFAFGRVAVEVGKDDLSGLALAVHHSVNVRGSVAVDGKAPGRAPIRLSLRSDGSAIKLGIYQTLSQRYVAADPSGAFTVIQVPPGLYRIDVGPGLPDNLYIADVRRGARSVLDSGFEIGSQAPDPIQVMFNTGAGTVEGVVQDSNGKPLAGVTVLLAPPEMRRQNPVLFHTATSDANGRYVIHSVAPGNYKLFSWQKSIPQYAWYNAGFMGRYEEQGRVVSVGQGATATQQITAIP